LILAYASAADSGIGSPGNCREERPCLCREVLASATRCKRAQAVEDFATYHWTYGYPVVGPSPANLTSTRGSLRMRSENAFASSRKSIPGPYAFSSSNSPRHVSAAFPPRSYVPVHQHPRPPDREARALLRGSPAVTPVAAGGQTGRSPQPGRGCQVAARPIRCDWDTHVSLYHDDSFMVHPSKPVDHTRGAPAFRGRGDPPARATARG